MQKPLGCDPQGLHDITPAEGSCAIAMLTDGADGPR